MSPKRKLDNVNALCALRAIVMSNLVFMCTEKVMSNGQTSVRTDWTAVRVLADKVLEEAAK